MKLYHYSNVKIKNKLKVKYFNSNYYTKNDYKTSNLKRLFFFTDKDIPEYRFKHCKYKYIVNIKKYHIYNLEKDTKRYKKKFEDIHTLLKEIKKNYKGVYYNLGYGVVCLFEDVKIKQKETGR